MKDGLFSGYLTSRELAHRVGDGRSRGCVRSDGWHHIPMIRMVNLSLMPDKGSLEDLLELRPVPDLSLAVARICGEARALLSDACGLR